MVKASSSLSGPASLVLVGYLTLFAALLLPIDGYAVNKEGVVKKVPYNFGDRLLSILSMLPVAALNVYSINCYMVGQCSVLSWITACIVFAFSALMVLGIVFFKPQL